MLIIFGNSGDSPLDDITIISSMTDIKTHYKDPDMFTISGELTPSNQDYFKSWLKLILAGYNNLYYKRSGLLLSEKTIQHIYGLYPILIDDTDRKWKLSFDKCSVINNYK